MAPTLVASYFLQQNSVAATALTTPSFTPSNGEVIVVKLATWDTATAMGAPVGGSQTYTSRITVAPGGFRPWVGMYTAVISGSPGSMTISSTPAASAQYSMTVERWSGAQLAATPATNSGGTTNGGIGSGAAASSLTTTAANSVLSWVAGDAQSVDPATRAYLNSATDEGVRDGHVGSNGVDYYAYQSVASAGSTSFGLSAPINMQWCIAGIEIQAASTAAPAFPPGRQVRRRLATAPRLPRNRARMSTPVRAQVNPPFPFTGVKQPRRLRALAPRRGESAMPVPAQVIVTAPKFPPSVVRPRLKGLRLFRGHASAPVPAQAVVVAPACPPQSQRSRVRGLRLFRGRAAGQVPGQDRNPTPTPPRPRIRGLRVRGHIASPIPAQIVVVPPAYPPQSVRTRLRGLRLFRGHAAAPVPPQIAVTPAAFVPQPVHTRTKGLRLSRGRPATPIPPQVVVLPPAYPPRPVRTRLKGLRPARGRESATPVPAQIVIVPPKFPPLFSRIKQHAARIFRGGTRTPVAAPVCDCDTHRPNAGVTVRPGMGSTARPGSGVTARGAAGMTARPDDGATTRPCTCSGGG